MRQTFIRTLCGLAEADERIWLLCGDLGYSVLEQFADRFPNRFVNAGVAEQNMVGVAAGLALAGKTVFTYSIANFATLRCLEQIRNDVCYHGLNVKIVAVGGGLAYGPAGYTHHAVEDLAIMRVLPNMTVVAPADPIEARLATLAIAQTDGPAYLRLGKGGEPAIHPADPDFRIGRAITLAHDGDATLIATGPSLAMAVRAAAELREAGQGVRVLSMPTIAPIDEQAILDMAARSRVVVTVEEHGEGGLGSVVAEILAAQATGCRHVAVRLPREPRRLAGTPDSLRLAAGLSVDAIVQAVAAQRVAPEVR